MPTNEKQPEQPKQPESEVKKDEGAVNLAFEPDPAQQRLLTRNLALFSSQKFSFCRIF